MVVMLTAKDVLIANPILTTEGLPNKAAFDQQRQRPVDGSAGDTSAFSSQPLEKLLHVKVLMERKNFF